jgi:mannose-6-phosphate isomerase-like protein (cupin superfamily)
VATKHFVHLHEALRSLETDPATVREPIKRTFLCDGQYVSANLTLLEDTGDALHVQPNHDELVLILEGECGFRVGNEVTRVKAGDLIFIPHDTLHGPILDNGRVAALSIFAPFFDRSQKNIRWSKDGFA